MLEPEEAEPIDFFSGPPTKSPPAISCPLSTKFEALLQIWEILGGLPARLVQDSEF